MGNDLQVLVAGRSKPELESLEALLRKQAGVAVTVRQIVNGHADPLYGIQGMPDLLILNLGPDWEGELKALAARPPSSRPPVLVVGPGSEVQVMRTAMQAGARDFLTWPVPEQELAAVLRQVARDRSASAGTGKARLTAVINAKGGSGATVLACNLAHLMAVEAGMRVALLDLDVQFGTVPLYFDLRPKYNLLDALDAMQGLDAAALAAYMAKHKSGVHLLGTTTDRIVLPGDIPAKRLGLLLDVLAQSYEQVVIDLPRQIDALTSHVLEHADQVVVVTQQGLTHLRDAKRLLGILTDGLAIPDERITVVVNRCQSGSEIRVADIADTLQRKALEVVPNDYKRVAQSVNLGVPLRDVAKGSPVVKALAGLAIKLSGKPAEKKRGVIVRALSGFLGN